MLNDRELIDLLASKHLSRQDKVLLILEFKNGLPTKSTDISSTGHSHGLRQILSWNLPDVLAKINDKSYITKLPDGWILTSSGRDHLQTKFKLDDPASTKETAFNLRSHLDKISNVDTREFVEESIGCLEVGLLRSAVVMSWVGAMSLLYDYVISDAANLTNFNARAKLIKKIGKYHLPKMT